LNSSLYAIYKIAIYLISNGQLSGELTLCSIWTEPQLHLQHPESPNTMRRKAIGESALEIADDTKVCEIS